MKIEHISMRLLRMKLRSHFETSFGRIYTRDSILISMTADGVVGYGECVADRDPGYSYETSKTSWHILEEFVIPAILGKDFARPADFQSAVDFIRGHQMAKAGVEMALWDILAKQQNCSLRELLGGKRERVDVGVSVGLQDTSKELVAVVGNYLAQGYGRIKIKIKPGRDIQDAQAVRQAFPHIRLQVDANSAYTLQTAASLLPLDALDLLLIEQPLYEDDIYEHSKLQPQFKTALCLDESILCTRHARQAVEIGACRIINIKAGRVGGLTEATAIHNFCHANKVPVWCGGMLETGVGRAANLALASLPGFILPGDISATSRYYAEDITNEEFVLNSDSTISVPAKPGLGVTLNETAIQRVTVTEKSW